MKRFKLYAVIFLFSFCLCGPAQASPAQAGTNAAVIGSSGPNPALGVPPSDPACPLRLTLERAKQTALENSPSLAAAKERVAQAIAAIEQARADYLPTVSLKASRDYTEETALVQAADETQYTAAVSASLVLFQGFYRKYNTLSAVYNEAMDRTALAEARRGLAWSVAQAFFNAQLAMENIRIARSDMAYNTALEKEAAAKERLGTGSYSDVLNYKTRVNTAKASLIAAEQLYKEYLFGLAALMGYEEARLPAGMEIAPLAVDCRAAAANDATLPDSDISNILDNRPDLHGDRLAVQEADARVSRAKSAFFPTVSLSGTYGAGSAGDLGDFDDSDNLGASLGLEVSFDLFSGGADKAAVRNAAAEKRALENELKAAQITAEKEIRTAVSRVEAAMLSLDLQQENARLMETTRDLVHKEYTAGQASLVRMNEAQNNLVASQGDLADAGISLGLALEELDYYTGRIVGD
ncbi:MAG: TolC family protein [Desulfobacter sp.]|nr:MAG: TolC family protein [Desulfobacter sp.]